MLVPINVIVPPITAAYESGINNFDGEIFINSDVAEGVPYIVTIVVANFDQDDDGQNDMLEYALGGNPVDAGSKAPAPNLVMDSGTVSFFNQELTQPDPGISYRPEWSESLAVDSWSGTWEAVIIHPTADPDYQLVERRISAGNRASMFVRVGIEQP